MKIIKNQDQCLVYDKNVLSTGISWNELQTWYDDKLFILDTGIDLKMRLRDSLSSPPELLFYDTYIEVMEKYNGELPALLPQVYLYYDPKLEKERIKTIVKITKKKGYKNNQQVGKVDIYLGKEKIRSVPVYVKIKK